MEEIKYPLAEQIIPIHTITIKRLIKLNSNCLILYMMLALRGNERNTNKIWATNSYCAKALGWSEKKVSKYKTILKKEGFIDTILRKGEDGKIKKVYTHVKYTPNPGLKLDDKEPLGQKTTRSENHLVDEPPSGKSGYRSAYNKKESACEKEDTSVSSFNKMLVTIASTSVKKWNEYKNTVKCKTVTDSLISAFGRAVKLTSESEIMDAINNYGTVIDNPQTYWYSYKNYTLYNFLYSGVTEKGIESTKGFWKFLDRNDPLQSFIRSDLDVKDEFRPITVEYTNIVEDGYYYGFRTEWVKECYDRLRDVKGYIRKHNVDKEFWTKGKLWELEMCIAHTLFYRRTKSEYNELSKRLIDVWRKVK